MLLSVWCKSEILCANDHDVCRVTLETLYNSVQKVLATFKPTYLINICNLLFRKQSDHRKM